jgi:hypothetical protein
MTICKTAYDTHACMGFVLKKIVDSIERAYVSGRLSSLDAPGATNGPVNCILTVENDIGQIPAFAHPILITNPAKAQQLVIDLRPFGTYDTAQAGFKIRNQIDYKLHTYRAKLNDIWIRQNPNLIRDISKLPLSIFASWVSEAVSRRFALDPREQMNLAIFTAIFYMSQFTDRTSSDILEEREKLRLVNAISTTLRIKAQDVLVILDKVDVVPSVTSYCLMAEEITGSIRLRELNVGLLFSIMGSSWSSNAKELVSVALEHPPTWIAILMAACTERMFKNSGIARLIERQGKDAPTDILRPVLALLNSNEY